MISGTIPTYKESEYLGEYLRTTFGRQAKQQGVTLEELSKNYLGIILQSN